MEVLAVQALCLVALVVIADGLQGVLTGALRGAADVWVPMAIHVGSFWLVLMPAAWLLAFPLGHGTPGLVGGMLAGRAHRQPAAGLAARPSPGREAGALLIGPSPWRRRTGTP